MDEQKLNGDIKPKSNLSLQYERKSQHTQLHKMET